MVVATAPHQLQAEIWWEYLRESGIPAMVGADAVPFLGLSPFPCRLLTPASYADAAKALLEELAEAAPLGEDPPDHP